LGMFRTEHAPLRGDDLSLQFLLHRSFYVFDFDQPSGRFPFISNVSSQIFPKKKKGFRWRFGSPVNQ
jgi:hypothetical protein